MEALGTENSGSPYQSILRTKIGSLGTRQIIQTSLLVLLNGPHIAERECLLSFPCILLAHLSQFLPSNLSPGTNLLPEVCFHQILSVLGSFPLGLRNIYHWWQLLFWNLEQSHFCIFSHVLYEWPLLPQLNCTFLPSSEFLKTILNSDYSASLLVCSHWILISLTSCKWLSI